MCKSLSYLSQYETIEEAKKAYNQVNGIIFPSDTGRKLIVGGLTPEQAESLIEYEQSAAEQRLRVNWEDVIQKVKAGEPIPSSPASDTRKTRSVGIGQIAKQLAQGNNIIIIYIDMMLTSCSCITSRKDKNRPT